MNKALAILFQYPNADPINDFRVVDHSDGNGQILDYWNIKDANGNVLPEPTDNDYPTWYLGSLKQEKINELNDKCNQSIFGGFSSNALGVSHNYPFDYEAQINFNQELTMLNADSTITSVEFKTTDAGVLTHTRDQFVAVCKDGASFKKSQIQKYWNLKTQVQNCTTEDAVNAISW